MDLDQKLWGLVMGVSCLIEWISLEAVVSKKKKIKTYILACLVVNFISKEIEIAEKWFPIMNADRYQDQLHTF